MQSLPLSTGYRSLLFTRNDEAPMTDNCRAFDSLAPAHLASGLSVYVARRPPALFCESRMLLGLTQTPYKFVILRVR